MVTDLWETMPVANEVLMLVKQSIDAAKEKAAMEALIYLSNIKLFQSMNGDTSTTTINKCSFLFFTWFIQKTTWDSLQCNTMFHNKQLFPRKHFFI